MAKSTYKDQLPGGYADDCKPSDFSEDQLKKGIEIELEHTDDPQIALEIAMDHLTEMSDYYDKLEEMESEPSIKAALAELNGNETDSELATKAEALVKILASKPLSGTVYYSLIDGDDEYEYDVSVKVSVQPAEPSVGITEPYVEEVDILKIVDHYEGEVKGKEFEELANIMEKDEDWVTDLYIKLTQDQEDEREYALERKYEQRREERR